MDLTNGLPDIPFTKRQRFDQDNSLSKAVDVPSHMCHQFLEGYSATEVHLTADDIEAMDVDVPDNPQSDYAPPLMGLVVRPPLPTPPGMDLLPTSLRMDLLPTPPKMDLLPTPPGMDLLPTPPGVGLVLPTPPGVGLVLPTPPGVGLVLPTPGALVTASFTGFLEPLSSPPLPLDRHDELGPEQVKVKAMMKAKQPYTKRPSGSPAITKAERTLRSNASHKFQKEKVDRCALYLEELHRRNTQLKQEIDIIKQIKELKRKLSRGKTVADRLVNAIAGHKRQLNQILRENQSSCSLSQKI